MSVNWRRLGVLGLGFLFWVGAKVQLEGLLFDRPELKTRTEWKRVGPAPEPDEKYPPQGAAIVDDELYLTNHWDGMKSELYRLDPDTGEVEASAEMPKEARHTSGLAWDGEWLWAVDHDCNQLYKLDIEATFAEEEVVVEDQMATGLMGSSGLTLFSVNATEYAAVSDFLWTMETKPSLPLGTGRTFVAPTSRLWGTETFREAAITSYANGGYSQGLTWDGEYLYESVNILGANRIDVLDINRSLTEGGGEPIDHVGSFQGPGYFIEDLTTDGETMWTSDELQYDVYKLDSLEEIRDEFESVEASEDVKKYMQLISELRP